jgi:L-methionine (R)-S-oxide reductase
MHPREESYETILETVKTVLDDETDPIVWMATVACLLKQQLRFFWVGFYRMVDGQLRIGPYQGTLGCLRIPLENGVCGAAARERRTVLVPDVHQFPGHIACDSRSQSEIVIPVFDRNGELRAVLDVDSDARNDFDTTDQNYLEAIVKTMRNLAWTGAN